MTYVLLLLMGLGGGLIGSLVGLGGGIIIVPALLFFSGYFAILNDITPQTAVGTSLLVLIFIGLSSTLSYMKHKTVDYKSGFLFFAGSGPGGLVGAFLNRNLNVDGFSLYFGLFVILTSIILMFQSRIKPIKKETYPITRTFEGKDKTKWVYGYHPATAIILAFVVGLFSGLFGVGGGSLMVPAMIMLFAFPPHVAVATSMLMVFLSSIISSITHISLGNVDWLLALFLVPGAWIGAKLGSFINSKVKSKTVVSLLRIILLVVGIRMVYESIVG